jgi:hypothetical protein
LSDENLNGFIDGFGIRVVLRRADPYGRCSNRRPSG